MLLPMALALLAGCSASVAEPESAPAEAAVLSLEALEPTALDLSAPGEAVEGVSYENGTFTITRAGQYRVTGSLDGQLAVDADGAVELILAGAYIRGPEALCVLMNSPVTITTAAGTDNTLYDGADAPDETATAALLSNAPLTLGGEGSLTVLGGANNGVRAKSVITVQGGTLIVRAADNGLKASGTLTVTGGDIRVTSGGDGLSAESGRLGSGDITVRGGAVTLAASQRGIDAEGAVSVWGGVLDITSADDAVKGRTVSVTGGELTAASACDGIQAETLLSVTNGALSVSAGDDALRAEEISILGGELALSSEGDGVQADTLVSVAGGSLSVTTAGGGGDAINKAGDSFGPMMRTAQSTTLDHSAKGLKSDGDIHVSGGVIVLDTADDAVHAGLLCTIDGGALSIRSSDDALHADDMLVINDGTVDITDCFEGLEAFAIEVNGGDITIRAVNDGINANGSEFGMMGFGSWGRSRQTETEVEITSISGEATTYYRQTGGTVDLVVTGNTMNVGDGIDSNGYVYIDGGVLTVSTFGNTQEGGIDTGRDGPIVTGGMVMAGGASMMQETWAGESTQCCAVVYCDLQPGGTPVTIYDENGDEIWTVTLENTFNCVVLSHPALEMGHVYTVDYGGGTETLDFTSSSNLRVGSSSSGWGFGWGFGFPGGFR